MADPIDPLDYLDLSRLLSDEERAIRDAVRTWVGDRVLPGIEDWFEAGEFPLEVAKKLGAKEQKERWLPAMARGEVIGCFGLTEPDSGSDPGSMRTSARRDGSDWVVSGTKMWVTNGSVADIA